MEMCSCSSMRFIPSSVQEEPRELMDASNILKPSLARGEIQLIGATTIEEYRKYIEKDPALERRFQPVTVDEPTEEEAHGNFKGAETAYMKSIIMLRITDEALKCGSEAFCAGTLTIGSFRIRPSI